MSNKTQLFQLLYFDDGFIFQIEIFTDNKFNQLKMSHANVTVTRTVTTTHPSAIFLNVGYLKSASGLLKIAQLVI